MYIWARASQRVFTIYLQNLASIQPSPSLVKFARSPRTDRPGERRKLVTARSVNVSVSGPMKKKPEKGEDIELEGEDETPGQLTQTRQGYFRKYSCTARNVSCRVKIDKKPKETPNQLVDSYPSYGRNLLRVISRAHI